MRRGAGHGEPIQDRRTVDRRGVGTGAAAAGDARFGGCVRRGERGVAEIDGRGQLQPLELVLGRERSVGRHVVDRAIGELGLQLTIAGPKSVTGIACSSIAERRGRK